MKFYNKLFFGALLLTTLFYGCNQGSSEKENEIEVVESDDIFVTNKQFESSGMVLGNMSEQIFYHKVSATGMVDIPPKDKAYVSVYYGANVKEIKLLVGQHVNKGDLLFTLQSPQFIKMQQQYLTAKGELNYLKAEYERKEKLYNEKIASYKDFSKSKADYNTVLTEFEGLKTELELINVDYKNLDAESISSVVKILAPISGNISEVNIVNGEYLNPDENALSIINSNDIHLELSVFEKDIANVKVGQEIKFTSQSLGNKVYEAEVMVVGKSINAENRSIDVHAHIENSEGDYLVPGMFVNAEILTSGFANNALPADAVVKVDDKYFTLVKTASNTDGYSLIQKEVIIGDQSESYIQILNADKFDADAEFLVEGAFNLIN